MSRTRLALLASVMGALALLSACGFDASSGQSRDEVQGETAAVPKGEPPQRPNVVVVLTDDQNAADLGVMRNVERLLVERGVTFSESFVNFPLCCPARATLLTGQYAHNHGVRANHLPDGGYPRLDSAETLPAWLTEAGYRTAYMGKFMNGVRFAIPPGWQTWQAKGGPTEYDYYGYTLNQGGRLVEHGAEPQDHADAVVTRKAVRYIRRHAGGRRPFFLSLGYLAPHVRTGNSREERGCGPQPAPRDEGAFAAKRLPRSPSFGERDVSDKPRKLRKLPKLTDEERAVIEERYRCRQESLLGVDRGVREVVRTLRQAGALGDTYIVFTSDNGLIQGEHRIMGGKEEPYEEAIRVPLVVRGPGIPAGERSESTAVNADLAPTIAAIAGAKPGLTMDGRSLLPLARRPERTTRRDFPITGATFDGVRTPRYAYVERKSGERELYDLKRDPHQLRNRAGDERLARVERRLAARLAELRECAGRSCWR